MTEPTTDAPALFTRLFAEAKQANGGFDHRAHVELTWLAVRAVGADAAVGLVADGLRALTERLGAPGKFHVTITRAWVELVAAAMGRHPDADSFDAFARDEPALLDKSALERYYSVDLLMSDRARAEWVEPDLAPIS